MSWRCGWRCWRERTRPRCGGGWTPTRTGSRSPPGRPPWRGHLGRAGIRTARRRGQHQPQPQPRLLLVVDQFEELFTQCADEGQRRAFITALHAAATAGHGPDQAPAALVVLGVRADFEARCADYPQLADAVQDRYLVTAMTERQLRMAITEPAKKAGSRVDDDLVEVLLAEVRTRQPGVFGAGVLPLLSHALDQAWRSRTGQALTLADYERTGGIEGAVAASAQRAYDRLTPAQQAAARQVFTAADRHQQRRRGHRRPRHQGGTDRGQEPGRGPGCGGGAGGLRRRTAAHPGRRHRGDQPRGAADRLAAAARHLAGRHPRRPDRPHPAAHHRRRVGPPLPRPVLPLQRQPAAAATDTATRIGADPARHPPLSQTERDFLHASSHAHRRTVRRRQAVIAGLLALTLTAVTAAGIAVHNAANATRQAANATRQHAIALSRQLAAESLNIDGTDPVTARRLAVAAWAVFPTGQAAPPSRPCWPSNSKTACCPPTRPPCTGWRSAPDGKLLASAGADGTVRLWNPATGQRRRHDPCRRHQPGSGVYGVAFSPDGKLLASAGGDGTVRLWNPATGRPVGTTPRSGHHRPATACVGVAFSPDGKLLASAGGDGTVRLWDPVTGRPVRAIPADASARQPACSGWRSARTASCWPAPAATARCGCGTRPPAGPSGTIHAATGGPAAACSGWRSARTASCWPAPAATARCGCGIRPPAGPSARRSRPATGPAAACTGWRSARTASCWPAPARDGTVRLWNPATGRPVGAPIQATDPAAA